MQNLPSRLREGPGVGMGREAHPAATNLACGSASLAPLPQAGGA